MREASTVHSEVWGCAQFTTPTEVPRTFTKTFHTPISLGLNDIPDTVSPRQPRLSSTSPTLPLDIGDEVTILLISSYFDFVSASPSIACLRVACTTTTSRSLECAGSSLMFDAVSRESSPPAVSGVSLWDFRPTHRSNLQGGEVRNHSADQTMPRMVGDCQGTT